jgi:hypothetical protein
MKWVRINSYKAMNADGEVETYHLERCIEKDAFRIVNDFGNNSLEFDLIPGYEMIKKIKDDYEKEIEDDLNRLYGTCENEDNYHW